MSRTSMMRALAGTAGVLLVGAAAAPGVAATRTADSGDVQATVRKTVLQTATANGEILTSRMYTQVSAAGSGTKTVIVPVGVDSNRNLNEFGPFAMEGQSIVFELDVDGNVEERTLTDADVSPMEVSVKVMLDGVEVEPADVVGADGVLDVQYTVRNTTARSEEITFADVEGNEITETIEVAEPYGGSLDITLPKGFNEITAPGATIAGDGTNQTSLGFSLVLFPPLGSPVATVGYQARISNGEMPAAVFSFLPIVPLDNSTLASTFEAYKGGISTGASIFDAGVQIGDNLLKLQEGAGQLVAGLGQLSAGASQLSDGLVDTAAPGAAALADGTGQVSDGLGELNSNVPALADGVEQLDDGANQLSDGLNQLDAQVPALASGAERLDVGAQQLSAGLDQLNGQVPALETGVKQLNAGAQQVAAGAAQLSAGLQALDSQINGLAAAVYQNPGYQAIQLGLAQLSQGLEDSKKLLGDASGGLSLISAQLAAATTAINDLATSCAGPDCADDTKDALKAVGTADAVAQGINAKIPGAIQNADAGIAAIGDENTPGQTIAYGVRALVQGIQDQFVQSADYQKLIAGGPALAAGAQQVADGTEALSAQVPALAAGVSQLAAGGQQLADGTAQLNAQVPTLEAGVSQLAAGGDKLAAGTGELNSQVPTLASGVQQLDEGAAQVDDGANQLSDGLGAAADGSTQLVDGLQQAEPGGAQIEAGAGQLKEEGADVLADTGKDAQLGFARDVALIEAAQQMGVEGSNLPFGPAEGTDVTTTAAVQMQLAGISADSENNLMKYGLGAALIAGAAGAAYAARRKLTA